MLKYRLGQLAFLLSICFLCSSGWSDMIRFTDGTMAEGKVNAFLKGEFHIQIGDENKVIPAEEVESFMVSYSPSEESASEGENTEFRIIQNTLEQVMARLERLEQLMYNQTDSIKSNLVDLQPESKLGVDQVQGAFDRKNEVFKLTGDLYSTAQDVVLNPILNIEFLDYYEEVVAAYKYRFVQSSISPNNRFNFKINFRDLPNFTSFKVEAGIDLAPPTTLVPKQLERIR